MSNHDYKNIHNCFKLNGLQFDEKQLICFANDLIKSKISFENQIGTFFLDWFDDNSSVIIQTSGTTGTPKKIKIEKQAMINSAIATGSFFDLKPSNTALHCLPTQFIAGKMMFVRAFVLGLEIDFVNPSLNPLENTDKFYDFAAMIPLQAQNSLDKLKNIKKLIIGGAKINQNIENELLKINSKIYETYGSTETITHIAAKRVGEQGFKILPNINIEIDERNCLIINAPEISNDKIVTNDLVKIIDKNHFKYIGRIDNVINSGGLKLFPEQIENILSDKINARFFVLGVPDNNLGEKLILVIESKKFEIEDSVFNQLNKNQKPKEIVFVSKFKETANGKILRKESLMV